MKYFVMVLVTFMMVTAGCETGGMGTPNTSNIPCNTQGIIDECVCRRSGLEFDPQSGTCIVGNPDATMDVVDADMPETDADTVVPECIQDSDCGDKDKFCTFEGKCFERLTVVECPPKARDGSGNTITECYFDNEYEFECSFGWTADPDGCIPLWCAGDITVRVICSAVVCWDSVNDIIKNFMVPNPNGTSPTLVEPRIGYCTGNLYGSFHDVTDQGTWFSAKGTLIPNATPADRPSEH